MASGRTLGASGWGQVMATALQQRGMAQRPFLSSAQSNCSLCSSILTGWVMKFAASPSPLFCSATLCSHLSCQYQRFREDSTENARPEATNLWPDQVDREKSGILTPEAIHAFLADVGLEASPFDMRHIMAELDPEHTGIVSRSSFISFIRYGGQPVAPPKVRH